MIRESEPVQVWQNNNQTIELIKLKVGLQQNKFIVAKFILKINWIVEKTSYFNSKFLSKYLSKTYNNVFTRMQWYNETHT